MQRIYSAGGYGVIGSAVARHIRTIKQDAEIILAGRHGLAGHYDERDPMGTGATNIRFDFAIHDSIGTRAGGTASKDLYIDLEGVLLDGRSAKRRITLTDPKGQAHFTALGILLSIERILGWDGSPPAPGAFYLPETLVPLVTAMTRIEQFGIQIRREERDGEPS